MRRRSCTARPLRLLLSDDLAARFGCSVQYVRRLARLRKIGTLRRRRWYFSPSQAKQLQQFVRKPGKQPRVYRDANQVDAADLPKLLASPQDAHLWPRARIVRSPQVLHDYRMRWDACQICGAPFRQGSECHHIIGGAGRSDEVCNLIMLCDACHRAVQSQRRMLPHVLWAKWRTDREHTDWVRLSILLGRYLPVPREGRR